MSPEVLYRVLMDCWWAGWWQGLALGLPVGAVLAVGFLYYRQNIAQCARDEMLAEAQASVAAQVRAASGKGEGETEDHVGFRRGS